MVGSSNKSISEMAIKDRSNSIRYLQLQVFGDPVSSHWHIEPSQTALAHHTLAAAQTVSSRVSRSTRVDAAVLPGGAVVQKNKASYDQVN
jgi:hypothetical protein